MPAGITGKVALAHIAVSRHIGIWISPQLFWPSKYSIDGIFYCDYSGAMSWEVEYTDEFGDWWGGLSEDAQEALAASVRLLEERGPALGFPHSSGINPDPAVAGAVGAIKRGQSRASPLLRQRSRLTQRVKRPITPDANIRAASRHATQGQLRFPGSMGRSTATCGNSARSMAAGHCEPCTRFPRRSAILLIGGDKTGDDRWYDVHVPIADRLYDEHLEQLRKEGLIDG